MLCKHTPPVNVVFYVLEARFDLLAELQLASLTQEGIGQQSKMRSPITQEYR